MMTRVLKCLRFGISLMMCSTLFGCVQMRGWLAPDTANMVSGAGSIAVQSDLATQSSDKSSKSATSDENGKTNAGNFELIDIAQLENLYHLNPNDISTDLHSAAFVYRRNELQDRLIAASTQRCGSYIRLLSNSKSLTDMTWGSFATLLSGAASVTTPASVARALAAGSTVSSGVMSQYDQDYFQNLSITVISSGIARQRLAILDRILAEQKNDLTIYSLNRAIADALTYHAACNIISGLETAAAATKNATNADLAGTASPFVASANSLDGIPVQQSLDSFQSSWKSFNQLVVKGSEDLSKFNNQNPTNTLKLTLPTPVNLNELHKNCVAKLAAYLITDTATPTLSVQANAWLISKSMVQVQQTYQPQFDSLQSAIANPKNAVVSPAAIETPKDFSILLGLCN